MWAVIYNYKILSAQLSSPMPKTAPKTLCRDTVWLSNLWWLRHRSIDLPTATSLTYLSLRVIGKLLQMTVSRVSYWLAVYERWLRGIGEIEGGGRRIQPALPASIVSQDVLTHQAALTLAQRAQLLRQLGLDVSKSRLTAFYKMNGATYKKVLVDLTEKPVDSTELVDDIRPAQTEPKEPDVRLT